MKPRSNIAFGFLAILPILAGCMNPYTRFYKSYIGNQPPTSLPNYEPCTDGLQIFTSDDFQRDSKNLLRIGFIPVGFSDFISGGRGITENNIREQAQNLGACRVLIATKYQGTVSGAIPWTMPTTNTSYTSGSASAYGSGGYATAYGNSQTTTYGSETVMIPYNRAQYEAGAIYFIKRKYQFGVQLVPVPAEITQKIGRNGGALINVVVQGTPAYQADILEGDVLWTINGIRIDPQNYLNLLNGNLGKEIKVEVFRGDQLVVKTVKLPKE